MTSPGQVAGATQQAAGQTAATAKDEASQVGQTAVAAASDVAGTAKEQVGQVAGEAVDQVRQLADQARSQVSSQANDATAKLSESLRSLAVEVRQLSQGEADGTGTVAGLARQLADKGEELAGYLSQQGPGGLVSELRTFAARRPGGFLIGALAAGLATGRIVKGAAAASSGGAAPTSAPAMASGAFPPAPVPYVEPLPAVEPPPAAEPYPAATPPAYGTAGVVLSDDVQVVGPVDDGLTSAPPYPPGGGLR